MSNLYIHTDKKNKVLLGFIQDLPENWSNISGLNRLSNSQLSNLSWAGHEGEAWLPLTSTIIPNCTYPDTWIQECKGSLKRWVSNIRWKKETLEVYVTINGNERMFLISERSKTSLLLRKVAAEADPTLLTNFKFSDGEYETLTRDQIVDLYQKISNYVQGCFDAEKDFVTSLNSCTTLDDLLSLNYNIGWPETSL